MKKNKIWKVLAVISSWGAVFVTGLVIGGNTSEGLQLFIVIAILIAIVSVGNCYTLDENMSDEEFDEYFRALMKKRYFEDRWRTAREAVKARKHLKKWEKRYKK